MIIKPAIQEIEPPIKEIDFNWSTNPNVKEMLDIISSIIAEEYIEIAKKNLDIFTEGISS